jgi:hypothetical protein
MSEPTEGSGATHEPGRMDLEALLADALRPMDPPEDLASRVETTLSAITEQAAAALGTWAEELTESELQSLRDPRNWVRPVVAVAVGTAAGAGLVVLRVRSQHRKQRKHVQGVELAQRTMRAAADEVKRVIPKR